MVINGKKYHQKTISLMDFLRKNELEPSKVVVEVNGAILVNTQYDDRVLKADDKVEIVSFVGGG